MISQPKLTPTVDLNDDDFISQFTGMLSTSDTRFVVDALDDVSEALKKVNGYQPGWQGMDLKLSVMNGADEMSALARHVLIELLQQAGFKARIEADPTAEFSYTDAPALEHSRMTLTVLWKQHQPSGIYAESEKL